MVISNKVEWVSFSKGIGIFLVVLGHIATPLTPFIYSWHIPLFIFTSGFFERKRRGKKRY